MKLFACLLIFLLALPFCVLIAKEGIQGGERSYATLDLSDIAQPGGGPKFRVAVDGYLLRTVAPDAARMKLKYVLPFVNQEQAEAAVAAGSFSYGPSDVPVFVEIPGEELPVEALMRADGVRSDPVAVPFSFKGKQRTATKKAPPVIARIPGAKDGREVVILSTERKNDLTRGTGIGFAIAGFLLLVLGVRVFRSWRRDRREFKAAVERITAERAGKILHRAAGGAQPRPAARGGFEFPWGKVVGALAVIGVIGAKVGKHAGSSVDDIARTAMRSADEVATLGKHSDDLTAGERALEALGTALDVETAVEVAGEVVSLPGDDDDTGPVTRTLGAKQANRNKPVTVNLALTVTDSDETYYVDHWFDVGIDEWEKEAAPASNFTPSAGEPLRFSIYASMAEASMAGRITGYPRINRTERASSLPNRSRGEFTQIELAPAEDGVRMTHVFAESMELGYVEIFRASVDLKYLNGGSWGELCSGDRPVTLGFTEAGRLEYAEAIAPSFARAAEAALGQEGVSGLSLSAEYETPPDEFIEILRGRLLLSQRGESRMRIVGGK